MNSLIIIKEILSFLQTSDLLVDIISIIYFMRQIKLVIHYNIYIISLASNSEV